MRRLRFIANTVAVTEAEDADNREARRAKWGELLATDPRAFLLIVGALGGPETVPDDSFDDELLRRGPRRIAATPTVPCSVGPERARNASTEVRRWQATTSSAGSGRRRAAARPTRCSNPRPASRLDEVASSDAADVDDAVAAAAAAFDGWSQPDPAPALRDADQGRRRDRGRPADTCSDLEMRNVGKPRSIIDFEMDLTVDNWRFFAAGARFLEGRAAGEYMEGHTSFLRRDPLGVVASIAPWNYPLNMATWKVGPALAAGNTVVLKPSELTPLSALRLAEITADILPPGVLNVVTGDGEHAGASLVYASRRRDGVAHRRRRDRPGDRPGRGRLAQARPPRARRQGAGDRLRRRRRRGAGRDAHRDRRITTPARTAPRRAA